MAQERLHLRGVVLPGGDRRDVFVREGRITFDPVPGARTVFDGGYLLPGLVDCHAHLALASPAPAGASLEEAVRASARRQLAAGVLAIREPGGPSHHSHAIGPHIGLPRTFGGGRFLAPPGRYVPGLSRDVDPGRLAEAAVEEYRASGYWAKVVGDFPGPGGRITPNFTRDQLAAAAAAVHAAGGRITIHAIIPAVIEIAIDAGFDAIEHGTSAGPEHVAEMGRRGMALVPTMLIGDGILGMLSGYGASRSELERWEAILDRQGEVVRLAVEAGVTVLAGTDAGMVDHGLIAAEIANLREAGLSAGQALGAGSWDARRFLGLPGIEEGAPADIVAYRRDPRAETAALDEPVVRILDGVEVRD
ncbi:MAG: amidohydrolase family protein [Chloroflexi bacterium]|nr:amidohydrolase family protein [Chloroflexota bacterium]